MNWNRCPTSLESALKDDPLGKARKLCRVNAYSASRQELRKNTFIHDGSLIASLLLINHFALGFVVWFVHRGTKSLTPLLAAILEMEGKSHTITFVSSLSVNSVITVGCRNLKAKPKPFFLKRLRTAWIRRRCLTKPRFMSHVGHL